jgi:hypothetical protein
VALLTSLLRFVFVLAEFVSSLALRAQNVGAGIDTLLSPQKPSERFPPCSRLARDCYIASARVYVCALTASFSLFLDRDRA